MTLFAPPNVMKLAAEGDLSGLISALAFQPERRVRLRAVGHLETFSDHRAVGPLITTLRDEDSSVRAAAVAALSAGQVVARGGRTTGVRA